LNSKILKLKIWDSIVTWFLGSWLLFFIPNCYFFLSPLPISHPILFEQYPTWHLNLGKTPAANMQTGGRAHRRAAENYITTLTELDLVMMCHTTSWLVHRHRGASLMPTPYPVRSTNPRSSTRATRARRATTSAASPCLCFFVLCGFVLVNKVTVPPRPSSPSLWRRVFLYVCVCCSPLPHSRSWL